MAKTTVKLFNDVSKLGFSNVDFEDQKSIFYQFQRYVVRKSIADNNAELSSIFKSQGDYSTCFNYFNSAFVGNYNMLNLLRDGELDSLPNMSNASFESLLNNARFDRQIALICYSLRNNERIPNRVDYPVLIAYANMQDRVLKYYNNGESIFDAMKIAGEETRDEFFKKYGCSMEYNYRTLPNGEKILIDRSVIEKIGYSGTLTVGQNKAYEAFVSSVVDDLFSSKDDKQISQVMNVLTQKVLKSHVDDQEFNSNRLALEVVYRFFMPTNELRREFLSKTKNIEQMVDYRVQESIKNATLKYNKEANLTSMKNLERFKSEKYKTEVYSEILKDIIDRALRDNVGLPVNAGSRNEKSQNSSSPTEFGE